MARHSGKVIHEQTHCLHVYFVFGYQYFTIRLVEDNENANTKGVTALEKRHALLLKVKQYGFREN